MHLDLKKTKLCLKFVTYVATREPNDEEKEKKGFLDLAHNPPSALHLSILNDEELESIWAHPVSDQSYLDIASYLKSGLSRDQWEALLSRARKVAEEDGDFSRPEQDAIHRAKIVVPRKVLVVSRVLAQTLSVSLQFGYFVVEALFQEVLQRRPAGDVVSADQVWQTSPAGSGRDAGPAPKALAHQRPGGGAPASPVEPAALGRPRGG